MKIERPRLNQLVDQLTESNGSTRESWVGLTKTRRSLRLKTAPFSEAYIKSFLFYFFDFFFLVFEAISDLPKPLSLPPPTVVGHHLR